MQQVFKKIGGNKCITHCNKTNLSDFASFPSLLLVLYFRWQERPENVWEWSKVWIGLATSFVFFFKERWFACPRTGWEEKIICLQVFFFFFSTDWYLKFLSDNYVPVLSWLLLGTTRVYNIAMSNGLTILPRNSLWATSLCQTTQPFAEETALLKLLNHEAYIHNLTAFTTLGCEETHCSQRHLRPFQPEALLDHLSPFTC